jgi:hypothetical protein
MYPLLYLHPHSPANITSKGTLFNFNTNTRGVMTDDLKAVLESRIRPITAKPRVKSA